MMTENEARKLEVPTEWDGRANVCVHCGKVPETFYVATGHDHTDYDIRWCPCREPNHNWCAGCSPDNCSGCGTEPVYQVCMADSVSLSGAWIDVDKQTYHDAGLYKEYKLRSLYTTSQHGRTAELEQLRQRVAELEKERDDWQDEALGSRINVETLRAERDDAITNLRVEQIAHLSLTDLLEKENEQLKAALKADNATAWAQAHRLALELECLLLDTKDNAIVSKWWDSGMAALDEYQQLKPGAKEDAEAWAKMRKETL